MVTITTIVPDDDGSVRKRQRTRDKMIGVAGPQTKKVDVKEKNK